MARQVLENGVVLPAEYSDDWYDDMTSNLTKLDDVIGSDSEKLSSADVGAAALSNNYNDLDNLPTIPTVNDAVLTIQKNGVDVQTFTANASSNVTANITVPTKTSDLINDSNFVDTSNSAVASGITSAKVTDYDSHIADTDIHVTTADKNKWNNQTYVFRYSSTALVASSTNANSLLDNTDNLKVGDKVIDSSGVLFSITAIDTQNSTFTIGTALIDLAQDSDVVHKSGDETIGGQKTFTNSIILQNSNTSGLSRDLSSKSQVAVLGDAVSGDNTKYRFVDKNDNEICYIRQRKLTNSNTDMSFCVNNIDNDNNSISAEINFVIDRNNEPRISPSVTDSISLGRPTFRWKSIYSNSYYYGNVEFSTKFVTTDTAQTVSGAKTFSDNLTIYNSDDTQTPKGLTIRNAQWGMGESGGITASNINFLDKNSAIPVSIIASKGSSGQSFLRFSVRTKDSQNNTYAEEIYYNVDTSGNVSFRPWHDNVISLGTSAYKWKDVQTNLVNGLTPSSLSLPSGNLNDIIDISSYLTYLDGSSANTYIAPANGWISITMNNCSGIQAYITGLWGHQVVRPTVGGVRFLMPILKDKTANILIFNGTIDNARFIPCQGNV